MIKKIHKNAFISQQTQIKAFQLTFRMLHQKENWILRCAPTQISQPDSVENSKLNAVFPNYCFSNLELNVRNVDHLALSLSSTLHNSTHLRRAHFKCQIWKRIHETSWLGIETIEFAKFLRAYTTTNLTSLIPQACYRVHFFMLSYFLFLWLIFIIHILSLRKVVCSPILFEHIYTFEVQGDFFTGKPLKS